MGNAFSSCFSARFFLRPCLPTRPGGIMCVRLMSSCLEFLSPGSFAPLPAATLASWWCRALPPGGRGGPAFVCQLPPPCLLSSSFGWQAGALASTAGKSQGEQAGSRAGKESSGLSGLPALPLFASCAAAPFAPALRLTAAALTS